MKWYQYLSAFGAGFFLGNVIPHLTAGVTGQMFPSPFGNPPGVGLTTPLTNVIWALINVVLGYGLLRVSKAGPNNHWSILAIFLGFASVSIFTSIHFGSVLGNPSF